MPGICFRVSIGIGSLSSRSSDFLLIVRVRHRLFAYVVLKLAECCFWLPRLVNHKPPPGEDGALRRNGEQLCSGGHEDVGQDSTWGGGLWFLAGVILYLCLAFEGSHVALQD